MRAPHRKHARAASACACLVWQRRLFLGQSPNLPHTLTLQSPLSGCASRRTASVVPKRTSLRSSVPGLYLARCSDISRASYAHYLHTHHAQLIRASTACTSILCQLHTHFLIHVLRYDSVSAIIVSFHELSRPDRVFDAIHSSTQLGLHASVACVPLASSKRYGAGKIQRRWSRAVSVLAALSYFRRSTHVLILLKTQPGLEWRILHAFGAHCQPMDFRSL